MLTASYTISTVSSPPPALPWNWEREQDCLSWHISLERTRRPPYHQHLQKTNSHWSVLGVWFAPPSISKMRYYFRSVCTTGRSASWPNHQSSLRRRNICHLSLFLTVIPPPSCRSSPGQGKQPPGESQRQSLSSPRFSRISKEYQNFFATAYNNKVFAPSLRCFDTVFWDHTSLLKSALRHSSPCRINVRFAILVGFGLNLSVVYISWKSIFPWQKILKNSKLKFCAIQISFWEANTNIFICGVWQTKYTRTK